MFYPCSKALGGVNNINVNAQGPSRLYRALVLVIAASVVGSGGVENFIGRHVVPFRDLLALTSTGLLRALL